MNQLIFINDLIKWNKEDDSELIERVLWLDPDNTIAYMYDIYANEGFPELRKVKDVEEALLVGEATKLFDDPHQRLIREEDINEKNCSIRDKAWEIIEGIIAPENEPDIYKREKRGQLLSRVVEERNITFKIIYKYLRKYWQRGKNKNALLPDYWNSGGKGKSKTPGEKKLGRPRKNSELIGVGINVDEATKKMFRVAFKKYYDTPKENYLTTAYEMMIKEFYTEDYVFENGVLKPVIIPTAQIPTITQFRYWYEQEQNIVESLRKRKGNKKFELEHRAVTGKSDSNLMGPGSKYQIDATVADVYLVSRYNRKWIIGRPVVYAVIDCFSRMVCGIYVGLEGPSWIGAAMALANAFSDKVSYCSDYGITINTEDWPCFHVPQAVLGDRGEMISKHADSLANGLGIRIENAPPYRADWKGIVEQYFHTLNIKVKPFVPGHVDTDFRERGSKDYRLDAKLDIYQFTKLIIKCALYHNNEHWMDSYETDEMMIGDDIEPIPHKLWDYGITNRSGRLRTFSKDLVLLNLMPSDKATVTKKGIKYKNMYYSCERAVKEMWFETARNKQSWKEIIAYDPRNMDYIYIKTDNNRNFEKCYLLDKRRYENKTIDEIEYLEAYENLNKRKSEGKLLQSKVDLVSEIESIVKEAEDMTNSTSNHVSNSSRIKNIRKHRSEEKELNRLEERFEIGKTDSEVSDKQGEVIEFNEQVRKTENQFNNIEYLRRKQKERMHGKKE